ncbi:MAG: hypothetical protein P8X89_23585, partial [Reinekea sp.]
GEGDLVLMGGNGKGGVKIDKDGNIKVWGVQVTIKGRGAVTFNGDVEYDPGAGNEPEEAISVTPDEIPEIEALELKNVETGGEETHYTRDANVYDKAASEEISLEIRDAEGNMLPNVRLELTRTDGKVIKTQTDAFGYLHIKKEGFANTKVRVLSHTSKQQ